MKTNCCNKSKSQKQEHGDRCKDFSIEIVFFSGLLRLDPQQKPREKKQADYLLLYERNWLKEGTEALVLKKAAVSSK